jgi:hypothetical protein
MGLRDQKRAEKERKRKAKVEKMRRHMEATAAKDYFEPVPGVPANGRFYLEVKPAGEQAWVPVRRVHRTNPAVFHTWGEVNKYIEKMEELRKTGMPIVEGRIIDKLNNGEVRHIDPQAELKPTTIPVPKACPVCGTAVNDEGYCRDIACRNSKVIP